MSAWTGVIIAVGVSSLICLALMVRAERIRRRRKLSPGRPDGGSFATSDGGSYFWSWAGNHSTGDHSACSPGSDGWGGGDSGSEATAVAAAAVDVSGRRNQRLDLPNPKIP